MYGHPQDPRMCQACKHSKMTGELVLWCVLNRAIASPCKSWEREAGTDCEEYLAFMDGHVSPDMGRGD